MPLPVKKRRKRSLTIRERLFLLRIGVGLFMGIAIGSLSFWVAAHILQKQHQAELIEEARLVTLQVNSLIQHLGYQVRNSAQSDEMEKYYASGRTGLLAALVRDQVSSFEKFSYVNPEGILEATVIQGRLVESDGTFDQSEAYLSALKNPNTVTIAGPVFDRDLQKPVIRFLYRHIDFFDNALGTIHASVSLQVFGKHFQELLQQKSRSVIISDTSGRIVYSPWDKDFGMPGRQTASKTLFDSGGSHQTAYLGKHKIYGIPTLAAIHHQHGAEWNVFVLKPTDSITKPLYNLCIWIVLMTLGIILCGEMLSRLLGIRIIEPINELRRVASGILADGNLQKRVGWSSDDEIGELSGTFNTMLDKIQKSQNQLQGERQFIEHIVHSMTDLLIVVSPAWDIMKTNANVSHIFKYHADEMTGQHFKFLLPATDTGLLSEEDEQKLHETGTVTLSLKNLLSKTDESIPLSLRVSSLADHQQEKIGYLITGRDIREKLKMEEERRLASEKLKEANEELLKTEKLAIVGQMSGMVAHEVLNPVSAMYARLDLNIKEAKEMGKIHSLFQEIIADWQAKAEQGQFEDYFEGSGQKDLHLLEKIALAMGKKDREKVENLNFLFKLTRRVIRIIDNLREMSRRKKTVEDVRLVKLIDEVFEDMGDGLRKRDITIEKNYVFFPVLSADYMEVYSILSNLLKNAVQAIDAAPNIEDRKIVVDLVRQNGSLASIQLKDTGIGMNPETEAQLFNTGFSNKGREGTGLGLSYSRKIARQMGGDLFLVKTGLGQGTIFQINLNYQRIENEKHAA